MSNQSCFEVITDLDVAAKELVGATPYYVLGGIATGAIRHPGSTFDFCTQTLVADPNSGEPTIRDNGTLRDIDVLVLEKMTKEQAARIRDGVAEAIDDRLEVSVFGLDEHREATLPTRLKGALGAWTSKRTVDEDGRLYYELFPLVQEVPRTSFLPWRLELPSGATVSIFNPAAHMLAYTVRSVSGIRPKDAEKVEAMRQRIEAIPEFKEQIVDGDLSSWLRFADNIQDLVWASLRRPKGVDEKVSQAELNWLRRKGRILHFLESNPFIVKQAQTGPLQKILKPFVGSA